MNGRLYDPIAGRMLSVDNYVQGAGHLAGFNRYTYAMNNPLRYNDPSGEILPIVAAMLIGAAVGGVVNLAINAKNIESFEDGVVAFGIGAAAGAIGGAAGFGALSLAAGAGWVAGTTAATMGFWGGAIQGAVSGGMGGFFQGTGNALYFQDLNIGQALKEGAVSAAWGAAFGGVLGGVSGYLAAPKFTTSPNDPYTYAVSRWTGKTGERVAYGALQKLNPRALLQAGERVNPVNWGEGDALSEFSLVLDDILNSRGVPYPKVSVPGYGTVRFPQGPFTPNNSSALRPSFTPTYKEGFQKWWTSQGRPWPEVPPGSTSRIDIHHIKPLAHGGTNAYENLVPLLSNEQHTLFTSWWRFYP